MHKNWIILIVVIATCPLSRADELSPSNKSKKKASLRAVIERLEARVSELSASLQQMKQTQRSMILGDSLLEANPFLLAEELDSEGTMRVEKTGIIRDVRGRRVGYWGIDYSDTTR